MPLAELAFPLLRGRADVLAEVDALIAADERVEVFEYCLSRLLREAPVPSRPRSLAEAEQAVATLLAVLADADSAGGVVGLDEVWPVLDGLAGRDKEAVVASMVSVLGHDGVLAVPEIELLRTVCAMLHCPLPPLARAWQVAPDLRK